MMKRIALALSLATSALLAADAPPQLLRNPGFEDQAADGSISHWHGRAPYYSIDRSTAHSGQASLHFNHADTTPYVLCSQKITMDKNKEYRFGCWVKSSGMKGGGPTICVQWNDANGKFLGGNYPSGMKDTNSEWKIVEGFIKKIPDKAASFDITCYARKGSTGQAWFDDVFLEAWEPPPLSQMTTDHYRHVTDGTPVTVFVGVNVSSAVRSEDLKDQPLVITAPDGSQTSYQPTRVENDTLVFVIPTADLAPGDYKVQITATTPTTKVQVSRSLTIRRVAAMPERKAYIDRHQRLILDGQRFFPIGLYFSGCNDQDIAYLKDSAFNCIMPYSGLKREVLDKLHEAKIKVIYSVKDFYANKGSTKTAEEGVAKVTATINNLKDHPAIMAWYINDEMPLVRLPELSAHRDLVETLDPGRPSWVVLYQVDEVREYIPSFDVIGTDPYPIPTTTPARALDWTQRTAKGVFGAHAVWMVPQIFNWAAYWKGYGRTEEEIAACRPPTLAEMRAMAWMCVAGGANGMVFYSWFDLGRMGKTIADGGRALRPDLVDPFDKRWDEVKQVAAELKNVEDVLLATDTALPIAPTADSAPELAYRLYGKDGDTWLLVVNSSHEKAATGSFQAPVPLQQLVHQRTPQNQQGTIADN
ncbi:MAG: carbohydrate binding domain-containing protein, partial [Lentisphaeria bacterium]|nr:carbohydrate binding domain-containing protein [Lentisphaeria bacterium]